MLVLVSKFKIIHCRNAIEHCARSGPKKQRKTKHTTKNSVSFIIIALFMILWIPVGISPGHML